jgi:shikimate dehydrogenase
MKPGASTRVFALLGDPVRHSLSPEVHNAGFRAAGLDAIYVALACSEGDLAGVMRTLVANGGGGNVTVPHKLAAARAGQRDERAEMLGVANVFGGAENGEVRVGNTDVEGLLALLDLLGTGSLAWCVAGTGGSARAVAGAARERGARLAVQSRDPVRAAAFSAWAAGIGVAAADRAECGVVINATPVGLHDDDPRIVDLAAFPVLDAVADLTYRATGPTPWVSSARARGVAAHDGREMLLIQGAAAWRYWFDDVEAPVGVMRVALGGTVD